MRSAPLAACFLLTSCSTDYRVPSLAPRAAESIDPRVPVPEPVLSATAEAALVDQLSALEARARNGHSQFLGAATPAWAAAGAAGASGSESWIAAQQTLSALVATRGLVTSALAEIDELAAARVQQLGGIAAADLRAIQSTAARVGEIDRSEAAVVDQLQARLRR